MTRLLTLGPSPQVGLQIPAAGEILGGKYRIERQIGSGGMGVVYEVTHLVMTEKRFAVKWLLPLADQSESQDAAKRFVREAQLAGRIRHTHVVEVYDVTIDADGCFMVMELLEGESLEARLRREQRLQVPEACRILSACAAGVSAAHAAHVIHRDLKPANIFLCCTPDVLASHPKVLDFGVSRFALPNGTAQSTVTRAGTLIGTPSYMASEQLRGLECDARTDVYALAVTLYECLSGQRAYDAPTYADLVVRVVTGDAKELKQLVPTVPAGLSAIVMRAMHHDPAQRFVSVEDFARALAPFVNGVGHTPELSTRSAQASGGRRGRLWAATTVAALGICVAAALWVRNAAREPAPAQLSDEARSEPREPVREQSAPQVADEARSEPREPVREQNSLQPAPELAGEPAHAEAAPAPAQAAAASGQGALAVQGPDKAQALEASAQTLESARDPAVPAAASEPAAIEAPSSKRRTAKRGAAAQTQQAKAKDASSGAAAKPASSAASPAREPQPARQPKPKPALVGL